MNSFLRPGMLRQRLSLEERLPSSDGHGGETQQWREVAILWADLRPSAIRAVTLANADRQHVTHQIRIRMRQGVRPGMRFRKGPRIFEIITVADPDETGRFLSCQTSEIT